MAYPSGPRASVDSKTPLSLEDVLFHRDLEVQEPATLA
jgi:hypothetical protein